MRRPRQHRTRRSRHRATRRPLVSGPTTTPFPRRRAMPPPQPTTRPPGLSQARARPDGLARTRRRGRPLPPRPDGPAAAHRDGGGAASEAPHEGPKRGDRMRRESAPVPRSGRLPNPLARLAVRLATRAWLFVCALAPRGRSAPTYLTSAPAGRGNQAMAKWLMRRSQRHAILDPIRGGRSCHRPANRQDDYPQCSVAFSRLRPPPRSW